MTPPTMTILQFILSGVKFGTVGKKIMTNARVTKHKARGLTAWPRGQGT